MFTFESQISGIPCQIKVTECAYHAPQSSNPYFCDSDLDYYGYWDIDWHVLDRKGYQAEWLAKKLTDADHDRIDAEIIEEFQNTLDYS
jgi:hypothetical protein